MTKLKADREQRLKTDEIIRCLRLDLATKTRESKEHSYEIQALKEELCRTKMERTQMKTQLENEKQKLLQKLNNERNNVR